MKEIHNQLNNYWKYGIGNLEDILNPNINPMMYKYLKEIGILKKDKVTVKVGNEHYPYLFNSFEEAEQFMMFPHTKKLNVDQLNFISRNKFEQYKIELI